jgi:hypothetical protein
VQNAIHILPDALGVSGFSWNLPGLAGGDMGIPISEWFDSTRFQFIERRRERVLEFEVKQDHITLFKKFYWSDNCGYDLAVPGVDTKRPLGDSDIEKSFDKTLGRPITINEAKKLMKEMITVMEIIQAELKLETGKYKTECEYKREWVRQ